MSGPRRSERRDDQLPERLSAAFRSQAERFEPSHDSYARLAEAVNRPVRQSPALTWLRPAIATVAVAVAAGAGIGTLLLRADDVQSVGTGPGDVAATAPGDADDAAVGQPELADGADSSADADADADAASTADAESTADAGTPLGGDDAVLGPIRSTELEAAEAFLDLLRLTNGRAELIDGRVAVRSFGEPGEAGTDGPLVATLTVVETEDGFAVAEATSDTVAIDEATGGERTDGTLTVRGTGTGFEGGLVVRLVSALDNRSLAPVVPVSAGALGEPAPFSADVPVVGAERAWVVVSADGGADGVIDPFAATPVSYRSEADPAGYAVVRVDLDDVDGGLKVRRGPGVANEAFDVLPPGSVGIRRAADYPEPVGDDLWWSIVTPNGEQGWVNSRFLAAPEPVSERAIAEVAARLQQTGLAGPGPPLVRRAPVAVGSIAEPIEIPARELLGARGWTETRSIPLPAAAGPTEQVSLEDFLLVERWSTAELQMDGSFSYPSDEQAARAYFAELSSFVLVPETSDGTDRRIFVFLEATPAGPEVAGIVAEVQQR